MRVRKTEPVGSHAWKVYRARAEEFLAGAETEFVHGRWNATGLGAVHAAMSFADAVLSKLVGIRSREPDHTAVVAILEERVASFDTQARRQLMGLLRAKNAVEYEARVVTEIEATRMLGQARRSPHGRESSCSPCVAFVDFVQYPEQNCSVL